MPGYSRIQVTVLVGLVLSVVGRAQAEAPVAAAAEPVLPRPEILPPPPPQPAINPALSERQARERTQEIKRPAGTGEELAVRAQHSPAARRSEASTGWHYRELFPLLSVIAVIVVAAVVIKRFMPARAMLNGGGVLEILARLGVSAKQQVVLVKLGRRLILLGVSGDRIMPLCLIDDEEQVASLLGEIGSVRPDSMSRAFAESFDREADAYTPDDAAADAHGHIRGLLEKVRRMAGRRVA